MSNGASLNLNYLASVVGLSVSGSGTLTLNGTWQNNQTLSVGGATLTLNGNWANAGAINVNGGTLNVNGSWPDGGSINATNSGVALGGTFTVASLRAFTAVGGTVNVTGTLDNTNSTLVMDGSLNTWYLGGGAIRGGTVLATNGALLLYSAGGTLDGVTVNGVLDVGNTYSAATLTVTEGLVLNGTMLVGNATNNNYGAISFAGNQVLGGNGTVVFGDYNGWGNSSANALSPANSGATLVLGPGITVRGQNGTIGTAGYPWNSPANVSVVNQGTISADVSGGTIIVAGASLSNSGQLVESGSGGSITVTANTLNTGLIGADQGTITFSGGFTQYVGTLDFGLSSPADFGQINLTGNASVGGTLASQLNGGYLPSPGDSFAVLNYGTSIVGFTNVALAAGVAWQTNYSQGVLTLVAKGILPLGVTISPTNLTVAAGSSVTFQATTSGPGPFGYQWWWNGVVLTGATNSSLVLSNVTSAASGAYTVQVSNASGSVLSAAAELSVLGPPAITTEPQSQTADVGSTVTFPVTATGAPPLSYQWSFDGQALVGATNATLTLTNVTRALAGSYSLVVTNAVGSVTSAPPAVLSIATGVACPGTPSGMVAWWRGEGNTGDYAGTNDAAFEGVAGYGPGEVGGAFLLDGVTSYLEVPNNALWAIGTNDFTVELWANFSAVLASDMVGDGSTVFIAHDEGSGARNKWLFGFGGGQLYFYTRGPTVPPLFMSQAPFSPITNQWYHLALTKAGGLYHIYVNGIQGSAETNSLPVPVANAPLTIGQAQDLFMDGLLDEISLYNRALAASEIQAIYQAGGHGKCGLESGSAIRLQAQVGAGGRPVILITGGQIGAMLTVEVTQDLNQWTGVGQVLQTQYTSTFIDPTPNPPPWRFYRVVVNP
jgi:formylmethanofuran dehydrogenase subunit C